MRAVAILSGLALLAACSVPTDILSGTPEPPPETWEQATTAAAAAYQAGRLRDAQDKLEAVRARAAAAGGSELDLATSLSNLAMVQRAGGNQAEAIRLYLDALAIRERVLSPNHPEVATTLNSLAAVHAARDDYAAAQPLLLRALTIREQALGASDRLTAHSLNNLALLYAAQTRFDVAEPLFRRAIAVFEGKHTDDLVITLENYAALLGDSGRTREADEVETRVHGLRAIAATGAAASAATGHE